MSSSSSSSREQLYFGALALQYVVSDGGCQAGQPTADVLLVKYSFIDSQPYNRRAVVGCLFWISRSDETTTTIIDRSIDVLKIKNAEQK